MTAATRFDGLYKGRRVLVTGHTGFKGSWLCSWLLELGADVWGYALPPPTSPSVFELMALADRMDSRIGDVRDLDRLQRCFEEIAPEIVFHLAAQPLVRESYRTPKETFDVNAGGTVNLLECIRAAPSVVSVVIVTSDKCYENREWEHGYRENDALGGHDPYSASKGCAELITAAYRRSFFADAGAVFGRQVGVASARAGNVIGGGDFAPDRLLPDCVRAVNDNRPLVVRNPDAVRPWQHVLEPTAGYLQLAAVLLADRKCGDGAWNFGPVEPEVLTVRQIAEAFFARLGRGSLETAHADAEPHEAGLLRLSCEKALSRLSWRPLLSMREALAWTVEWYAAWIGGETGPGLAAMIRDQIECYAERSRELVVGASVDG